MYIGCPTLGRRLASLAGAVAVLAATVTLTLDGSRAVGAPTGGASPGGSPTSPCRQVTCTVSFAVGSKVRRWNSRELFFPANEQVLAKLVASKAEATRLKSYGATLCKHRYFGSAMSILVTACGSSARVRVRAVRLKRGLRRLTITYAADPYMGDAPARESAIYTDLSPLTGLTWD